MTQRNLFPNEEPLARNTDEDTSHIAAAKLTMSGRRDAAKWRLYEWMSLQKEDLTAREISHYSKIPHPTVHKRLADLRRDGYVVNVTKRTCRVSGEFCLTWKVSDRRNNGTY